MAANDRGLGAEFSAQREGFSAPDSGLGAKTLDMTYLGPALTVASLAAPSPWGFIPGAINAGLHVYNAAQEKDAQQAAGFDTGLSGWQMAGSALGGGLLQKIFGIGNDYGEGTSDATVHAVSAAERNNMNDPSHFGYKSPNQVPSATGLGTVPQKVGVTGPVQGPRYPVAPVNGAFPAAPFTGTTQKTLNPGLGLSAKDIIENGMSYDPTTGTFRTGGNSGFGGGGTVGSGNGGTGTNSVTGMRGGGV